MSSFYGNISNVSKTQLQFDAIYPNRVTMEDSVASDDIAVGRYVLVSYGEKAYPTNFFLDSDGKSLFISVPSEGYRAIVGTHIQTNDIVCIIKDYEHTIISQADPNKTEVVTIKHNFKDGSKTRFYKCTTTKVGSPATVEELSQLEESSFYTDNYQTDKNKYGIERGYDATVWTKVVKNGALAYQYVADLNSIVPSFSSTVTPPSEQISAPVFTPETDTNVLYNLNVQPTWGFRVKAAAGGPSDEKTSHVTYNGSQWVTKEVDANIFFNEAGFNPEVQSESNIANSINVTSKGVSGYIYSDGKSHEDTKELSIILPAIGNTISKVWDLVYKPDANGNRDTEIQSDSLFEGENYDMSTIAGCIRTAQDVLGQDMIKEGLPAADQYENEYDNAYIYKQDGKYYIIVKKYSPVYSETNEIIAWNEDGYELKEINLNEPINSIFGAMAQMNQELNVAEEKIGAYYKHLNDAVDHLDNFKTINLVNAMDREGGSTAPIVFEAEGFEDSLTLNALEPLYFRPSVFDQDKENSLSLDIHIAKELVDDDYIPISSKAVKTEVDNIISLIGEVRSILEDINN